MKSRKQVIINKQTWKYLMSCKRYWLLVWIMLHVMQQWPNVHASTNLLYTRDSLNSVLYDYAFKKLPGHRTGQLFNVSLPLNFSSIEVSAIRFRTRSLWLNGVNLSSFEIPPGILPWPFTRRVDIVYQHLGNWSSFYYNVPNYTLVAPVLGVLAYDSNSSLINQGYNELNDVELNVIGNDPVIVRFSNVSFTSDGVKCVRFGVDGTVEFSNVTAGNSCVANGLGHFSVVIPYEPINERSSGKRKWWVIGVVFGVAGLVLLVLLGFMMYKMIKRKKIREMEKESERSEGLDTTWIGRSRMPSASGIRTQSVLENSYVP